MTTDGGSSEEGAPAEVEWAGYSGMAVVAHSAGVGDMAAPNTVQPVVSDRSAASSRAAVVGIELVPQLDAGGPFPAASTARTVS